jgi:hypothetical protein
MMGHIDLVTPEGLVSGWCWNEQDPGVRVHVAITVDGVDMGGTLACQYREDLKQVGIGDGHHAFQLTLNQFPFAGKREQRVTLIDKVTGNIVCPPFILRSRATIGFDERIEQLEARSRLLEERLRETTTATGDASYAELFAMIGNFFSNLAQNVAQGRHLGADQKLDAILKGVVSTFLPLHFAEPERHELTILIEGSAPLRQLHTCLVRLKAANADMIARIVVIDTGLVDEVALIPSIVRGVSYVRATTDLSTEWLAALRAERSEFVLLLNGRAVVSESFIDEMIGTFRNFEAAGAVGGCASKADGMPRHGGLCLQGGTLVDCAQSGHPEPETDIAVLHPVHALSHLAVCFRTAALRHVGGLDDIYGDDLGAAVVDLCFRLHQQGWSLLSQPLAGLSLQPSFSGEGWMTRALQVPSRAGDLLRGRWFVPETLVTPLRVASRAVVVGRPGDAQGDLAAALHLQKAGYSVIYITSVGRDVYDLSMFRRIGVSIFEGSEAATTLINTPGLLIFATERIPLLRKRAKDSTLVIGLRALKRTIHVTSPLEQVD